MKILVVEDDASSSQLLRRILSSYGECDLAVDGEEGLKAFVLAWKEEAPYGLVCMDVMMPGFDGMEAAHRIRNIERSMGVKGTSEVKIIMVTALGDPKTVISSYNDAGATSYIVKPVRKDAVVRELRQLDLIE